MKKQAISLVLVAGLMLSLFMGAMVLPASATVPLDMYFNHENSFEHDATMRLGSAYHASGFNIFPRQLDAYLMRSVEWYTNDGGHGYASRDLIQTDSWSVWGSFDTDYACEFDDTLDLTGLNFQDSSAPDQWLGVHWVVGYYIQYKWLDTPGEILGQTGIHHVGCNELATATYYCYDYGVLQGGAAVYQPDGIDGFEDNYEAALYGYYAGDSAYISGTIWLQ